MLTFLYIVLAVSMLGVLASLGAGLFGMAQGGAFNKKYGNRLMRMRVILQGVAIVAFMLALAASN